MLRDDRYIPDSLQTVRRDGSSRFSKDNRWGTFPSVALAWRVSQENFFEPLRGWVNDLKLRASYGVTGQQDGITNYGYIPVYTIRCAVNASSNPFESTLPTFSSINLSKFVPAGTGTVARIHSIYTSSCTIRKQADLLRVSMRTWMAMGR